MKTVTRQNYSSSNTDSIFNQIQDKFNIIDVARDLGLRIKKVGGSFRANSIDVSGRGENALALYESTNSWYDFLLEIGGDITDLVAHVRFNGDIKEAIHFLMPDADKGYIDREFKARKQFDEDFERWHKDLIGSVRPSAAKALDYLHSRGITDDTIRALKIGVKVDNCSTGGFRIVFPYWNVSGEKVIYFTTRRYDWSGNGEDEKQPKYKKASLEQYPFLYNAPMGLNTLNRMKDDTLVITEGVVDWLVFFQEGYSVLSPNGGDFGKMWKDIIDRVKKFKRVVLAFDSDEAGQKFTYKAAKVLLAHKIPFYCVNMLTKDVAEHYQLTGNLDAIMNSVRKGISWLLQYITPKTPFEELSIGEREDAMTACKDIIKEIAPFTDNSDLRALLLGLRKYFPLDWLKDLFEMGRKGPSQADVASMVCSHRNLLFNSRTGFYEYQNNTRREEGTWKQVDDETIMGYIESKLGRFATGGKLSSILKLIQANSGVNSDIPVHTFNTQPLVSFRNGTLDIDMRTGSVNFREHSMYDYVTVRMPYSYNPEATCPQWEKFIREITGDDSDSQDVLQEFAGYILAPHCKFQKALMLKGGGSNGKSVFFNIISALLGGIGADGRGYVSSTEPSKWSKDFRLMPLRHSWVNISSDAENDLRGAEGVFKKVVAGEVLEDSYKHKDPIPFSTRSKLMMACNFFPIINDTSDGFMRRWLIVELPMHFVEKGKVRPYTNDMELDPFLEDKLMKELPGIFNWMLKGLQRLLKQKQFTHTHSQDALINEFRSVNNPLYSFVEDKKNVYFSGSATDYLVDKGTVFGAYKEWAENNNVDALPSTRFYSNIQSVFSNLSINFAEFSRERWIFYKPEVADDPEV